jgi:DNA-binding transcriptional ArsR family regulator
LELDKQDLSWLSFVPVAEWTFLSNHAHVLLCIARDPEVRLRDIALKVDITERAAHRLLSDLVQEGYVSRERQGRRNRYRLKGGLSLRHPLTDGHPIDELLAVFGDARVNGRARKSARVKAGSRKGT